MRCVFFSVTDVNQELQIQELSERPKNDGLKTLNEEFIIESSVPWQNSDAVCVQSEQIYLAINEP